MTLYGGIEGGDSKFVCAEGEAPGGKSRGHTRGRGSAPDRAGGQQARSRCEVLIRSWSSMFSRYALVGLRSSGTPVVGWVVDASEGAQSLK